VAKYFIRTTDGSTVYVDATMPVFAEVKIWTSNADKTRAQPGDTLFLNFAVSEELYDMPKVSCLHTDGRCHHPTTAQHSTAQHTPGGVLCSPCALP
jgi:hypothetical protein